ncbi:MAG: glycosyltransferase family 4 protein, partial [Ktedonobacteraceae bacterium]
MRIALDYTAGIQQEVGVGHYVRSLLNAMLMLDVANTYTLLTSGRPTKERPFPAAPNIHGHKLLLPHRSFNMLWHKIPALLPTQLFTGHIDMYHGLDDVLPPLHKRILKVVTIHNLTFLEHPEYVTPQMATHLRKVIPIALAEANVVVVVSHENARTLLKHYTTPPEKITIIPYGLRPHLRRITDPILRGATTNKFGLKHPLVLGVGALEPRKNQLGLIRAFHQTQHHKHQRPAMLALAGGGGWLGDEAHQLVTDLKLEKKVRFLGRVSDLELAILYSLADVCAFPSFFNNTGLSPLEAMACGAPIIVSNTVCLPEIVGEAALTVNPHEPAELATAIMRLIGDKNLSENLRQQGYTRAQSYTWPKSAKKMLDIYTKLYNGTTDFSGEVVYTQ